MPDVLIAVMSLPNLHPAVVHFPIALLPVAVLFDTLGLFLTRQRWLAPAATTLYGIAAVGAGLAVKTGESAADGLVEIPPQVQVSVGRHSDWAHYALYLAVALAVLRLIVHLRPKLSEHLGARVPLVLLGFATVGVLAWAADLGGYLVYSHGLAVERPAVTAPEDAGVDRHPADSEAAADAPQGGPPEDGGPSGWIENQGGVLVWQSMSSVGSRDEVLAAAEGSSLEAVRQAPSSQRKGLEIAVDGEALLVFPGTLGDVQVEARVELLGFEGELGLAHHVRSLGEHGVFTVTTGGRVALKDRRSGERQTLDEQAASLPEGPVRLAVSAAGRHLKGLVDGKTVAHGHIAPGPDGACGLWLAGRGRIRIDEIRIIPLTGN